jgi:hypothetical protein
VMRPSKVMAKAFSAGFQRIIQRALVRGHEKVPTDGQVRVPTGGQVEVPTLRSSCRSSE